MLRKMLLRLLAALECQSCDLGVLIIDDARMRRLNAAIAVSIVPPMCWPLPCVKGPLPISTHKCWGCSALRRDSSPPSPCASPPLTADLTRLLIHVSLHVLGYDHEVSPADARLMRAKERELWRLVKPLVNVPLKRQPPSSDRKCPRTVRSSAHR
jgi:probable rRNA maturation factor